MLPEKKLSEETVTKMQRVLETIDEEVAHTASWLEEASREWDQGITEGANTFLIENGADLYQKAINSGFSEEQAFELAKKRMGY